MKVFYVIISFLRDCWLLSYGVKSDSYELETVSLEGVTRIQVSKWESEDVKKFIY